ncbi:unnamed protein product, partial [Brenthis ino]
MWCFLLLTLFVTVQGRAVNISNTWVLPEEGFPVFYRYFRDRISWYEADAVCQFHHANLVTVDTTAQYDAVRAYLKELDISSAVWVGLIRSNPDGDFTWTDYRGLSGDGYWSSAPDTRSAPLCAAADPTADYRWEARACGGPSVASFICELPVPQWALGNEGCMLRALPALTVLYLPESAAVQLTVDCGLDGVKRVQCTGNMKREDLLKDLSCTVEDQVSTTFATSSATFWATTTDTSISDQEINNELSTEENGTTQHEDDINQSISTKLLSSTNYVHSTTEKISEESFSNINQLYKFPIAKNINIDVISHNNLQSNDISSSVSNDDLFTNEQTDKLEDEKHMQHKKLHEELARLGNFETIFNQPTDHFVPPLVMAKAKISDDMTALSIEEKLAQQLAERQFMQHENIGSDSSDIKSEPREHSSLEKIDENVITDKPINTISTTMASESKYRGPKEYNYDDIKPKMLKKLNIKSYSSVKTGYFETSTPTVTTDRLHTTTTVKPITQRPFKYENQKPNKDSSLELTVIIKDPEHIEVNETSISHVNVTETLKQSIKPKKKITPMITDKAIILNDEVIRIQILKEKGLNHSNIDITVYEVTTKVPSINEEKNKERRQNSDSTLTSSVLPTVTHSYDNATSSPSTDSINASRDIDNVNKTDDVLSTEESLITIITDLNLDTNTNVSMFDYLGKNLFDDVLLSNISLKEKADTFNETDFIDQVDKNNTDETTKIDDLNSPLLSAASEPLHKPIRSRRPQQNRVNKFNPFRILG